VNHPAEIATTDDLVRGHIALGDFDLTILTDGPYLLDGGAMFGVVPKTMWQKRAPANDLNQILLGTNTIVVRTGKEIVVIETGIGNKLPEKLREIFDAQQKLLESFRAAGIRPDEVSVVINSHLHFDHCGWNTSRLENGRVVPTFPNARYFAHRGEVEHGHLQLERDWMSYISDNYDPLIANGQMTLLDLKPGESSEIAPGVSVEVFPGHTAQMMAVMLDSGGQRACYVSDLIPTSAHLDTTWGMGYDLYPLTVIEERKRFLSQAIPEQWLVLFTHDHDHPMGYVAPGKNGRPELREGKSGGS
jgi:glyoxylase-like metal-dependent hydrolase (beta-lactamase superfamily II)